MTAEQVTAAATVIQAFAVVGALWYAWRQLVHLRDLNEAEHRPFVVVELDAEKDNSIVYVHVTNYGTTLARDVRFTFDPTLTTTFDDAGYGVAFMKMFTDGIPTLAPGRSMTVLFDTVIARVSAGLPSRFVATIRYRGEGTRTYEDEMVLDLAIYLNRLHVDRKNIHNAAESLEKIAESVRVIAQPKRSDLDLGRHPR